MAALSYVPGALGVGVQRVTQSQPIPPANSGDGLVAKSCLTPVTPWTVACQAPLSMGFSRQDYWNGLPLGRSKLLALSLLQKFGLAVAQVPLLSPSSLQAPC